MVERAEVEALLAECASEYRFPQPLPDLIEELCRTWLAVDSAPVVAAECCDAKGAWLVLYDDASITKGQQFRMVHEAVREAVICGTCEPDGIYTATGIGPLDCYVCGKAARLVPTPEADHG